MFFVPELLQKKSPLSRCWLAGILTEKMFKSHVSNVKILEINISATCDEIINKISTRSEDRRVRYSLSLSARLMCGVVKIHSYQLEFFQKSVSLELLRLQPAKDDARKKKPNKHTIDLNLPLDITECFTIPSPPTTDWGSLSFRRDQNLLQEVSPESVRRFREAADESIPNFGPLTDEQAKVWMEVDFVGNHSEGHREISVPLPTEDASDHPLDVSSVHGALPVLDEITPRKRRSNDDIDDRPAKRRRTLRSEMDVSDVQRTAEPPADRSLNPEASVRSVRFATTLPTVQEEIVEIPLPADHPVPEEESAGPMQHPEIPPPIQDEAAAVLEAPPVSPPAIVQSKTKSKKKRKSKLVDKNVRLSASVLQQRNTVGVDAYTIPTSNVFAVPERAVGVSVSAMCQCPSLSFDFSTGRYPAISGRKYSDEIIGRFRIANSAQFVATPSGQISEILEYIRTKNTTVEQIAAIGNKTGHTSAAQEDTPSELIVVVDTAATLDGAHTETIQESHTASGEPDYDCSGEPAAFQAMPEMQPEIEGLIENRDVSDVNPQNSDGVLPESTQRGDVIIGTHQQTKTAEVIIDVAESVTSSRSEIIEDYWSERDVMACLEVEWHNNSVVSFRELNPPETTRRVEAAAHFNLLLHLSKAKKVVLTQTDQICIEKAI